jgi:hypothetical protein
LDRQLQLTDLVPRRPLTFALVFAAGLGVIAVLEAVYALMPLLAPMTTDGRVATFDLEGEGSLAVWFSCATLEAAALAALTAWAIRRHTPGRQAPRILLVAAACWLVMSIDECGSLHEAFKELMSRGTGNRLHGDGTLWWVIAYAIVLSSVGCRLAWELRRSPEAVAALLAAAGCYVVAVLAELAWLIPHKGVTEVMLEEGCEMLGNLCLLMSMGLYARFAADACGATTVRAAGRCGNYSVTREAA